MDEAASPPPEQPDTEQGFGSGLRAQLARSQEAQEHEQLDEGALPQPEEAASPAGRLASGDPDETARELEESIAHAQEFRRELNAQHAKLAEWVAAQGREIRSPEAAALLASGAAEAELDRQRAEAERIERQAEELAEREAAIAERERLAQARVEEAEGEAIDAKQALRTALARERELNARAVALEAERAELETRSRGLDERERELAERESGLEEASRLAARDAELDERAAGLDAREAQLVRREEALVELKDWLVRRERELAAYLGEPD